MGLDSVRIGDLGKYLAPLCGFQCEGQGFFYIENVLKF
uniref:Uncharacterized protein n=1 Tax=Arundo donax TaxID=35708 RepID=A0A0A9AQZ8_ARUDO